MFKTIKNALKTPEVRKKLLYTLLLIVIFRLGCYITIPGVDTFALAEEMSSATNGVTGLIDTISGGAFSRLSIFAMSITPYITASIVIQLLGMVIPALERLTKEGGEEGRTKINKYTKILTIVLALIEGLGIFFSYKSSGIFLDTSFIGGALTVISLMAGTALLIWLGEQITNKGIGNGISMIIFVGIISGLPRGITAVWGLMFSAGTFSTVGFIKALALVVGLLILVAGVVFIQIAERRIPVQYAKRVVGRKTYGGQSSHIPMKVNQSGVMPIIFASSLLAFPQTIAIFMGESAQTFVSTYLSTNSDIGFWIYRSLEVLLIVFFSYFYTTISFNTEDIAENMKNNGGFIPGIRPGMPTVDYLNKILSKLTLAGAVFLAIIAMIPAFTTHFLNVEMALAGTSILIVVGVALELKRQLESHLVMRSYQGFLK